MAIFKDRVRETTTTTGTGTLTLAGTLPGYQSFAAVGDGNQCYYVIVDSATGDWETGLGTYTAAGTTLSRDTVYESSNAGAAVSFAAGTKDVYLTYPSAQAVDKDTAQTLTNKTVSGLVLNDGYTEEVFAVSGTTPALSPTNGSIQTWTLSGNSTPTASTWASGQSITLMIDDGAAFTVTWTSVAVTWKTDAGSAPTLNTTGYTAIVLWKVGTTIYGARVGDA